MRISSTALLIILVAAGLVPGCQQATQESAAPSVEYLSQPRDPDRPAPFSEAVRVGNTLYLTGKLGTVPGGGLAPGGIEAETRQALENMKGTLERYGSSMNRVVKCTVFLADIAEWGDMNAVYLTYFPNNPPARSAVGVSGLARGARVEIECIATVNP
jgi:2-iminobutanoate/2-iminopropanoate deaminase